MIEERFAIQHNPDLTLVNGNAFINSIEKGKYVLIVIHFSVALTETVYDEDFSSLSPREAVAYENLLKQFKIFIKTQGIVVRQFFQQYDKLNKGYLVFF